MPYVTNTREDRDLMLRRIGVDSVEELFDSIPRSMQLKELLDFPAGLSEMELDRLTNVYEQNLVGTNRPLFFLGGGCYDHFIPSVVDALASDPRFVTAYTPYQAEASQGSLQTFFEYQTLIARLFGMDLSNASHYDAATACVEAVLMACAATGRKRILVPETLHPEYRQVLDTYLIGQQIETVTLSCPTGSLELAQIAETLDNSFACLIVQNPNFFGNLESLTELSQLAHDHGALSVACVDPISLGILKRPGDAGADIVVAEGQPLGIPMSFGGPSLGIIACSERLLRRIPGRLVGQTKDRHGTTCWVLTMQTREQHIRREKATSNICSNQGLMAVRAAMFLAAVGPVGLREAAELCVRKAHYLAQKIVEHTPIRLRFDNKPFFKEFTVRLPSGMQAEKLVQQMAQENLFPGIALSRFGMEEDLMLIAVTEKRSRSELDLLVQKLQSFLEK